MATNARKHEVPEGPQAARRAAFGTLSASLNDIIPVANTTERSQLLLDLGWTPTAARPLYIYRADAGIGLETEYTTDGVTWRVVPGEISFTIPTGNFGSGWAATPGGGHPPRLLIGGSHVELFGSLTRQATGTGSGSNLLTIPSPWAPGNANTQFVGSSVNSAGGAANLAIGVGVLSLIYGATTPAVGVAVPIRATWQR